MSLDYSYIYYILDFERSDECIDFTVLCSCASFYFVSENSDDTFLIEISPIINFKGGSC